jgi:hypothetical protein
MSTAEATFEVVTAAELIVAGAPLLGFNLPTDTMVRGLSSETSKGGPAPDLSHPTMRTWLDSLPKGAARVAAFETKISWSPGSSSKAILGKLEEKGYRPAAKPQRFVVKDRYGPLKEGELERAKAWGAELAHAQT